MPCNRTSFKLVCRSDSDSKEELDAKADSLGNSNVADKDDVTAANSKGGKKREDKTVNTAKKAALIQLSSKILEKQQELWSSG